MEQSFLPAIWTTSPCTLGFSHRVQSFQKTKRFQFNSIYYKDDPCKPKLHQDPLSRPQMLLSQFRKKIKQATKSYHTMNQLIKKKKNRESENSRYKTLDPKINQINGRLYQSPSKVLQLKYDSNGNRSSYFEDRNVVEKQNHLNRSISPKEFTLQKLKSKQSDNIYITSTPRTDLSKPLNFHPGPGSYDIKAANQQPKFTSIINKSKCLESQTASMDEQKSKYETVFSSQFEKQKKNKLFGTRLQRSSRLRK